MTRTLALLLLVAPAWADRAVTAYGEVFEGAVRVEKDEVVLVDGEDETRRPARGFLLVERDDGAPVWSPSREAQLRGYAYLARHARRELLVDLVAEALRSRNARLARRVFEMAEADGFTGKAADKAKKRVEALEKKPKKPVPAKVEAVEGGLKRARALHADLLVARARKDEKHGLAWLRAALRIDPEHAAGLAMLAKRAPEGAKGRFWLDFQVDLAAGGARQGTEDARFFARIRDQWRKDLHAVAAGPIRLYTPVEETGAIGRCLNYGRVTCRALDAIFKTDNPQPRVAKWMVVFMYGDKEEYLKTTGVGRRVENPAFLEWSLGYFSPIDRISRVFWHENRDAERRIARTFVHELTHHWLMELNPSYANRELRRHPHQPGYWIIEGFATFMEEGIYDIDDMTWTLFDARAQSVDVVAAVGARNRLIPWKALYGMHQLQAQGLRTEPETAFVRRWAVGEQRISQARLFYEQAAATCHYLYHGADGRHRSRLVDYVVAAYTGKRDRLTIENAFGMTPDVLGLRVVEYAGEVAKGWRPSVK